MRNVECEYLISVGGSPLDCLIQERAYSHEEALNRANGLSILYPHSLRHERRCMSHEVRQTQHNPAQTPEGLQTSLPHRRIPGAGTLDQLHQLYVLQGRGLGKELRGDA